MTTRPKRQKAKAAAKRTARKKSAAKQAATKQSAEKAAASKKSEAKTRGRKPARRRKAGSAKKAARPIAKARALAKPVVTKTVVKAPKRSARLRQLTSLAASGRRPKSIVGRGRRHLTMGRPVAKPRAPRIAGVAVKGAMGPRFAEVLTPAALRFLAELHREFEAARAQVLSARAEPQQHDTDRPLGFLPGTEVIRHAAGDRPAEIVSPTDPRAMQAALASGADRVTADFATMPAQNFASSIAGQIALKDHWAGRLADSREAETPPRTVANLSLRPRGWDAVERQLTVDGAPIAAALLDFGLGVFHNAARQVAAGSAPAFDLLQLDGAGEARLWNDVLAFAQERLGLDAGTIRATLRIRSEPGTFELIV